MIKTIVFDFGNVVGFFDYGPAVKRLAQFSPLSAETLRNLIFGTDLEDAFESGRISSAEFMGVVQRECQLTCSAEEFAEFYGDIFWDNPEVRELLPRVKRHQRLLLGSNTTPLHSQKFTQQFADSLVHFDGLVLSWEIGVRKPRPGFFEHCVQQGQCSPEECLFIDDLAANVAGARACGLQALQYLPGENLAGQLRERGISIA